MYAIFEDSGSQFKVATGDVISVDVRDLTDDQKTLEFDRVLMVGGEQAKIGKPLLDGAKVTAEILGEQKGEKVTIIKFRKRQGYRRKNGHRQNYLRVRVTDIAS